MIKEVSLQANNAAAWYVKDWKDRQGYLYALWHTGVSGNQGGQQ